MMRRLPPGFRFEPTEEELVFEYLKCKVFSSALPASIIPEINGVWNLDPWDIPATGGGGGEEDEEKYLFSKKYNNNMGGIVGWSRSGYWKERGLEKEIVSSDNINNGVVVGLVGMKKTLDFCTIGSSSSSKKNKTRKTGWVMHEYRLRPHYSTTHQTTTTTPMNNNNWVLCRIACNKSLFNHRPLLHYSISSTNHYQHQDHNQSPTTPNPFSDDDDSLSSTASSSSTSAAFSDFTSPATTTTFGF